MACTRPRWGRSGGSDGRGGGGGRGGRLGQQRVCEEQRARRDLPVGGHLPATGRLSAARVFERSPGVWAQPRARSRQSGARATGVGRRAQPAERRAAGRRRRRGLPAAPSPALPASAPAPARRCGAVAGCVGATMEGGGAKIERGGGNDGGNLSPRGDVLFDHAHRGHHLARRARAVGGGAARRARERGAATGTGGARAGGGRVAEEGGGANHVHGQGEGRALQRAPLLERVPHGLHGAARPRRAPLSAAQHSAVPPGPVRRRPAGRGSRAGGGLTSSQAGTRHRRP